MKLPKPENLGILSGVNETRAKKMLEPEMNNIFREQKANSILKANQKKRGVMLRLTRSP